MIWVFIMEAIILCGCVFLTYKIYKKTKALRELEKKIKDGEKEFKTKLLKTAELNRDISVNSQRLSQFEAAAKQAQNDLFESECRRDAIRAQLAELNASMENIRTVAETAQAAADEELKRRLEEKEKTFNHQCAVFEIKKTAYQKEVEQLKSARDAIILAQKREEECATKQRFYMLSISEESCDDIKNLRKIEDSLHDKEVLAKLIWTSFYQSPYKDLVGRVIGARKISGIYKITSLNTKQIYVGKSVDIGKRWSEHIKSSLGIGSLAKNQLYTLMKKDGAESFTFELLEEVEEASLLERESYWIKFYQSDTYGLNMKAQGSIK